MSKTLTKKIKRYWLAPDLKWTTFKKIYDRFPDSGITVKGLAKILWQLLRDRKINIYLDDNDDGFVITLKEMPKGEMMISNPK